MMSSTSSGKNQKRSVEVWPFAIFAGTSTGANVTAALRLAKRLGPSATIVTLACEHGLKYISTDLYR